MKTISKVKKWNETGNQKKHERCYAERYLVDEDGHAREGQSGRVHCRCGLRRRGMEVIIGKVRKVKQRNI